MVYRVRAGVVIVEDGRLAVIERHRSDRHYFTLPGGGVEPGETVEEAAVRESHEELGVEIELLGMVGTVTLTRGDRISLQHYLAATVVGGHFGTGVGPEYQPGLDPVHGTYHPTWLTLADAVEATVHPRELVTALRSRGVDDLLARPVQIEELAPPLPSDP